METELAVPSHSKARRRDPHTREQALVAAYVGSLQSAAALVEGPADDDEIHALRKHLRTARALLRLLRPAIGRRRQQALATQLREVSQSLSAVRDYRVLIATLDALTRRHTQATPHSMRNRWLDDLQTLRSQANAREHRQRCQRSLEQQIRAAVHFEVQHITRRSLAKTVSKTYARAQHALRCAADERDVRALHELRRRSRRLLSRPDYLQVRLVHRLRQLTRALGRDRDLWLLRAKLASAPVDSTPQLLDLIDAQRVRLQTLAITCGAHAYADSPDLFARKMRRRLRNRHRR
jgi:inorganic triphosphatase YgiF